MKKKEMLKEQKRLKEQRNEKFQDFSDKSNVNTVIYISIGVILFIGLTYLIINIANGTWTSYNRQNPIVGIDTKLLMCGTLFDKSDKEYLVLAYNIKNKDDVVYSAMFESYKGELPLYYLDLESGFNKHCVGDKTNLVNDSTKIMFNKQTLLHIKDGKIVKSYVEKDQINNYLTKEKQKNLFFFNIFLYNKGVVML